MPEPRRPVLQSRGVRVGLVLLAIALTVGVGALIRSYRFYSQIIDARLASGYLTSRPGLYAAPRVLQTGQKLSREKLVVALRRAGYLESKASDVWSGSFTVSDAGIDIRPGRASKKEFELVRVSFSGDQIAELRGDGFELDSFTLEPEILSNDLSSKVIEKVLTRPSAASHAIAVTELESMPPDKSTPSGTSARSRSRTASRKRRRSSSAASSSLNRKRSAS